MDERSRRELSESPGLQNLDAAVQRLETRLKEPTKGLTEGPDAALHESIMRVVRRETRPVAGQRTSPAIKCAFAGAVVCAVLLGGWAFQRNLDSTRRARELAALPSREQREAALAQLPDVWGWVAQTTTTNGPDLLPQPLAQPVRDLVKNMRGTADYLKASLP